MNDALTNQNALSSPEMLSPEMVKFIESIALYYENYGIPRIAGRMFGLLLISVAPLSAEQIASVLNASLSSISTNVRALIANGWVEKVTSPGERTTYYRFAPSAWESVMERRRQGIAPLKSIAGEMQAALPPDHPAREQLNQMMDWADLLMTHYETLITTWKARMAEQQSSQQE